MHICSASNSSKEAHLYCGEGGHNGRGPEPVGDHGEVGEMPLYAGVQDGLGSGVAQRGPVLVQQVHQLLCDAPEELYCFMLNTKYETLLMLIYHQISSDKAG